jgi:DNA-binding NtrC family response regulator
MTVIRDKSILIIDDDAALLRALNRVLSEEGAMVTSARWAGEAVEYLADHQRRFDLIITDLRMPILSGTSLLGAVRVAFPKVPVIIVTAFGNGEREAECLDKGAAAFLEKPLDTPTLLAAIERVLSPHQSDCARRVPRPRRVRKTKNIDL